MNNIYQDISERTNGDIYIGVVGPVRSGKSTFVSNFMTKLILPNIADKNDRKRATDELPQSADGKIIMTTQPKFVPNTAVRLSLDDKATANVRLIDCVGYLVDGAEGHLEGDKMRLVNTPWSTEPIPFEKAAEIGTQKVATEHSTVAIVVTTDGSIGEIPRQSYISAEERVIRELKLAGKPFIVVLNSKHPEKQQTRELALALQEKYGVTVLPLNIQSAEAKQMEEVMQCILKEFPIRRIAVDLPMWMRALGNENKVIMDIIEKIKVNCAHVDKMKEAERLLDAFADCEYVENAEIGSLNMGSGVASYKLAPKSDLFFKILSEEAQMDITDEYSLMSFVTSAAYAKSRFEAMKDALDEADANGYGIVYPRMDKMSLNEPEMVKQGTIYGVRLKATSPSYHIIRVDVATEVSPMVGTEQQSQYLLEQYKQNPEAIWNTNMFGKTMAGLAKDGLEGKCTAMPIEIKQKLTKTLGKIVNENRGGLFCLLL
ncbi:MAG: stage IV sporulation protein A [Clostridiales bacterium]|nr:stage IV sporulation protein A [Clostridiales bacterium]